MGCGPYCKANAAAYMIDGSKIYNIGYHLANRNFMRDNWKFS
jgi:hypothetical protein